MESWGRLTPLITLVVVVTAAIIVTTLLYGPGRVAGSDPNGTSGDGCVLISCLGADDPSGRPKHGTTAHPDGVSLPVGILNPNRISAARPAPCAEPAAATATTPSGTAVLAPDAAMDACP
jgi:hypothetical protein